jgi:FtsH-binding integral membrane protein
MNTEKRKTFLPLVLVFIILNGLILFAKTLLETSGFDSNFLIWANLFLFFLSVGGFMLQQKGLQSQNPQAFVRGVYASMMFKMFICMIVVLVYVFLFRSKINKPGIFTAMGMYIVYTVVEVTALIKVARNKKNA